MFEVGKKVICIKNQVQGAYKKGKVYELFSIRKGCKHYPVLLDIGIKISSGYNSCPTCKTNFSHDVHWCNSDNFAPYDDSLSELTAEDILEETQLHTAEQA